MKPSRFKTQGGARYMAQPVNYAEGGNVTRPGNRGFNYNEALRQGIIETAAALQVPPAELATIISYETGGTMDPMQPGPKTQWGQHRGFIQFGEPQAKQFGVDFSNSQRALESQLGADGAIVKYALERGFKPGEMDAGDLYSTINAGAPGRWNATDENNSGAPGTVAEKYTSGMAPHRAKMYAEFGGSAIPEEYADAGTYNRFRGTESWNQSFGGDVSPKAEGPDQRIAEMDAEDRKLKRMQLAMQMQNALSNPYGSEQLISASARPQKVQGLPPMAIPEFGGP